jgi:L-lysine 2,3-aminomutase
VSNQAVLLRGVNDAEADLLALCRALLRAGVRAYYLHQCDPVRAVTQFRVGLARAEAIVRALTGKVSGLAIPHFVVDLPGGEGKVAASGPFLVERGVDAWTYHGPLSGRLVRVAAGEGSFGGAGDWLVEPERRARYAAASFAP